jgi:hypothetical protein
MAGRGLKRPVADEDEAGGAADFPAPPPLSRMRATLAAAGQGTHPPPSRGGVRVRVRVLICDGSAGG